MREARDSLRIQEDTERCCYPHPLTWTRGIAFTRRQTFNLCLWYEYWARLTGLPRPSWLELFSITHLACAVPWGSCPVEPLAMKCECVWMAGLIQDEVLSYCNITKDKAKEFNFQSFLTNLGFLIQSPSTVCQSAMVICLYSPSSSLQPHCTLPNRRVGQMAQSEACLSLSPIFSHLNSIFFGTLR